MSPCTLTREWREFAVFIYYRVRKSDANQGRLPEKTWRTTEFCLPKFYVNLPDHLQRLTQHPKIKLVYINKNLSFK